jgi:hypothetical protein
MPTQTGFLPSRHGFAYRNDWPSEPVVVLRTPLGGIGVGNAAGGLCGGMVFAALDYWHAGLVPPAERPCRGDAAYRFLVRRLLASWRLPAGVARYYRWMLLPDSAARRGVASRTVRTQLPAVLAQLDRGRPVPLGVVTVASIRPVDLALNHQVLAYGYRIDADGAVTLRVYDPNRGPVDDATIRLDPLAFGHTLGLDRPARGFFRTRYRPVRPPRCGRAAAP